MHSSNLSIVFAPNSLYSRDKDPFRAVSDMVPISYIDDEIVLIVNVQPLVNGIFQTMLDYKKEIFDYWDSFQSPDPAGRLQYMNELRQYSQQPEDEEPLPEEEAVPENQEDVPADEGDYLQSPLP
jgi:hypothetical protein